MDNSYIWGGGTGSWTDPTQWLSIAGGSPGPGDIAAMSVGTIDITGLTLVDVSITVSFQNSAAPELFLADVTIDAGSTIADTGSGVTPAIFLDGVNAGRIDIDQALTEAPSTSSTGTFDNQGTMNSELTYLDHGTTLLNQGVLDGFSIQVINSSPTLDARFINDGTLYNQWPGVGAVGQYGLPIEGTGTIVIPSAFGVANYFNGVGAGQTIEFVDPMQQGGTIVLGSSDLFMDKFEATIENFRAGDVIGLNTTLVDGLSFGGNVLTLSDAGIVVGHLNIVGNFSTGDFHLGQSPTRSATVVIGAIACFASGTRIATQDGDVAVDQLRAGMCVLSVIGGPTEVVWVGRRYLDCRRHPHPWDVWPVRVRAGAFGQGVPRRDLRLSPDHCSLARR